MVSGGGKTSAQVALQGTLPEFEKAGTQVISEGRFFTQTENDTNQEVCVVGSKVADDFFKIGSPMGQTIKIGTQEFRVVGILEKREQFLIGGGSDDQNNVIYVPFTVAQKLKPNADDIYILAVARPGMMEEAKDQVRDMLRVRRQVAFAENDNFGLQTSESILDNFRSITAMTGDRDGRDLVGRSDGGRDRRNEHHAGVGHRANTRDRRAQSDRREAQRHHVAVSNRSRDADRIRRDRWSIGWLGTDAAAAATTSFLRSALGAYRRPRRQHRDRAHLRPVAGVESRAPRSHRITQIRVAVRTSSR